MFCNARYFAPENRTTISIRYQLLTLDKNDDFKYLMKWVLMDAWWTKHTHALLYVPSLSCVIKLCLQRANKNISTILYFCTTKKERLGGNPQIFLLKQLSKTQHFIQLKYQCWTPTYQAAYQEEGVILINFSFIFKQVIVEDFLFI